MCFTLFTYVVEASIHYETEWLVCSLTFVPALPVSDTLQ